MRIPCPQASQRHLLQYLFIYAAVYAFFLSCLSVRAYFYGLRRTFWIVPHCSLRPTLSLVTFSVMPSRKNSFSTASADYERCRQKRGGLLEVSSRIARACLRRTVGALLVLWSCKAGAHTLPASIPKASASVSVHIRGRLCLFLVLLIRACIFLWPAAHILDRAAVLPLSHSQSSDVFCVAFCA